MTADFAGVDSSASALRVLADDDLLWPLSHARVSRLSIFPTFDFFILGTDHSFFFLCSLQFWVARRERASLLFFHDECDSHSLPKNWSLPATEFTTAQDVIEGIAALCDHDVTHGALPFLYWQLVGDRPLVDDSLQAVDSRALLVDFVNAAERQKVRIRFVISFALPLPTRTVSPRALSPNAEKLIKLDGDDADALQRGASSGKRAPPPPRGLLRQKSSSSLALTDAAPPPVLKRDKSASKIVILTEPTTPASCRRCCRRRRRSRRRSASAPPATRGSPATSSRWRARATTIRPASRATSAAATCTSFYVFSLSRTE
jgi:hypothetical protein